MKTRSRWVVGGAALVVLVGGGATAYAATRDDASSSSYRLASVTRGTVEQTLTSAGTVDKRNRADVSFQTSGTIAKVAVTLGQHVTTGQVVATLDPAEARADLYAARATLAKARAQLVSDESAQSSSVSSSQSTGSTGSSGTSTPRATQRKAGKPATSSGPGTGSGASKGSSSTTAVSAALARLAVEQKAVTSAQSAVTSALDDAAAALTTQTQACSSTGTSTTPSATASTGPGQACQDASSAVQAKQQVTRAAEQTLSAALTALTTTLTTAVKATQQATLSSASESGASTTVSLAAYTTSTTAADDTTSDGGSGQQQSQSVTAATLAKDQAAIDTARAGLIDAQQSLAATVVRAPITGTVASLELAAGDSATTGDTATVITNGSALLVDTTMSESKIREITVGQEVVVSTPGSSTTSAGTVASIGVTADSDSSAVSYPVTVEVPQPSSMLGSGSSVVLEIVTDSATDVVTVPSSAVATSGSRSTVRVRDAKGAITTTAVTLGAVGASRTQIKSGLTSGQEVVLADLDQTITGASTSVSTGGGGGAGGPGGGSGGPGGAGGGRGGPPGSS